jgi:hypothetical protein
MTASALVICDHADRCPWMGEYDCPHRKPHAPLGKLVRGGCCETGGDCGTKPGVLMWTRCKPLDTAPGN